MRCQHIILVEHREQLFRILPKNRDGVSVDDQGRAGARQRQNIQECALAQPCGWTDNGGVDVRSSLFKLKLVLEPLEHDRL